MFEELFRKFFNGYQEKLQNERLLDFDDMLVMCYELLSQRPDILWPAGEDVFVIFLSMSFRISIRSSTIRSVCWQLREQSFYCRDDDQSIYQFQGARPEIMLNFQKDYPEAERYFVRKIIGLWKIS